VEASEPNAADGIGFVGREAELSELARALQRAAEGEPRVVLITGAAGIGKSTLLDAALSSWRGDVVAGSGDEDEAHIEFALLEHLLRAAPADVPVPEPGTEPFRAAQALLALFEAAEPERPLALVVDDAGWGDLPSLQAIAFAVRRLRAEPVALLVASRDETLPRLPAGLVRIAEAQRGRIDLAGLDADGVATIASRAYGRPLPTWAAARLRDHTAGNPLHVRALVREVPFERMTAPGQLPAPRSFATLVISRLALCSDDAQRLLAALAVLGREASLQACASVAGVGNPLAAVDELARQGFVELAEGGGEQTVRFVHDLVHASVLGDLSPAERKRLHAAAATVTSGERALQHRIEAAVGPDPGLLGEVRAAAEERARRGGFETAAELLETAVPLAGDEGEREDVAMAAITHRLRAAGPPGPLAAELPGFRESPTRSYLLGRIALITGRQREAVAHLQAAWQGLPDGHELRPEVADTLALAAENEFRFADVTEWTRRSLGAGSQSMHTPILLVLGIALTEGVAAGEAEMSRLLEGATGGVRAGALLARGIARLYGNDLDGALADLEEAGAMPEVAGSILGLVNARGYVSECHYRAGRWAPALTVAEAIGSIAHDADQPWLAAMPQATAAFVLAGRGDLDRATEYAEQARLAAEASGLMPAHLWVQHARLRIAAAEGDGDRVAAIGDEMRAGAAGRFPEWVHRWRATYVEGLIAAERFDDAETMVAELEAEASASDDVPVAADAARARGTLESARGNAERAEQAFAAGLELDPVATRPFERARLELAAGAYLRRAGQRRAAQSTLSAALERFNLLGARPWIERCERELRACGLRPAKRSDPAAGADLTPQERMVAHLVAGGATNREVATELVLSVKTIEHHLGRIYRKLGIRSRTELAALLAAPEEPAQQD
jgi:DNA-binding CsgD family transcriptional regulator